MKIRLQKEGVYIPTWNDNHDLSENEQIKVHFKYLPAKEREKYVYNKPIKMTQEIVKKDDSGQTVNMEAVQDSTGIFEAAVIKIENLETEDGLLDTAKKVLDAPDNVNLSALISEVGTKLCLLSVDKKK